MRRDVGNDGAGVDDEIQDLRGNADVGVSVPEAGVLVPEEERKGRKGRDTNSAKYPDSNWNRDTPAVNPTVSADMLKARAKQLNLRFSMPLHRNFKFNPAVVQSIRLAIPEENMSNKRSPVLNAPS